ncbi:hypothetical protein STANM309S_06254 [Streptomyces tanashiensis]
MELQTASTHSLCEPVSALYEIFIVPPGMPPPSATSFFASAASYLQKSPQMSLKPPSSPRTGEVQSTAGVRVFWKIVSVIWLRSMAMERPWRTFSSPGLSQAGS